MSGRHRQHLKGYFDIHRSAGSPAGSRDSSAISAPKARTEEKVNKVLTEKPRSTKPAGGARPKINLNSNKYIPPKIVGKANINHIPDEILLKIFGYFTAQDLLCAARVCRRWLDLANDNLLWREIHQKYVKPQTAASKTPPSSSHRPPEAYWKTLCIKQCAEERNKRALRMMKKTDPYTGLPKETATALKGAGVFFQLVLIDTEDREFPLKSRDIFYHGMSVSVRWFDLEMPPVNSIRELRLYAGSPLFFRQDGQPIQYSPFQRSLLLSLDVKWDNLMKTQKPSGSDDIVNLYSLPQGFMLATYKVEWHNQKADGGIAFIAAGLPSALLVKSCLLGTSSQTYQHTPHKVVPDDIDPKYGLHDYTCTVEIRTLRQSIWNEQYKSVNCKSVGNGYAIFPLIRKDYHTEHVVLQKKVSFPWKTDAFKGIVENVVWMDVTVLDERREPMWCLSSAVKMTGKVTKDDFNFDYTSRDVFVMSCADERGKLTAELSQTDHGEHFISSLNLMLSLEHINSWFGTCY